MNRNHDKTILLSGIISILAVSMMGLAFLLLSNDVNEPATGFEFIVFVMASAALILAVVQSVAIERQMRIIRHASAKITEAAHLLDGVVVSETEQSAILHQDLLLDEILIATLTDHGYGGDEQKILATLHDNIAKHRASASHKKRAS